MSAGVVAIVVLVVIVAAVGLALAARPALRRRELKHRFGPEYDRVLAAAPDRRSAENELLDRERRHAELDLRPLTPGSAARYRDRWTGVQEQFVDDPAGAVTAADRLVTEVMAERGYPTDGFDQRVAHLSVRHTAVLEHYRAGHEIAARGGEPSTEDQRTAIVHFREIFQDLLDDDRYSPGKPSSTKDVMS